MLDNLSNNTNDEHDNYDKNEVLFNHKLIPYIIYWFLLWAICIFYAHVQISTRFICCSCPALYWFCAEIIYSANNNNNNNNNNNHHNYSKNRKSKRWYEHLFESITSKPTPKLIIAYFLLYFSIGTLAFSAFLPFV